MAVAAYASLVSLTNVLDNLHYRAPFHLPHMDMKQIETLQQKVHFLVQFVEHHSERESPEIQGLWRKMAEAAFGAEDMIDFYVVNHFGIISSLREKTIEDNCEVYSPLNFKSQEEEADSNLSAFRQYMEKVISEMDDCIKKDLSSVLKEEGEDVDQAGKQPAALAHPIGSSSTSRNGEHVIVGIDEHVVMIVEKLVANQGVLQILPISGMGGIGKTTLAENVFNHQCIVDHFEIRVWFTISQEYSSKESLKGVLYKGGNKQASGSSIEFGDELYRKCFGRRCLIVFDDVWTIESWNDLKRFFPNGDKCKIRVMLTTRLLDVATYAGTLNPYLLPFLDEASSWELFCKTTFQQIGCPYIELEEVGKDIVKSCKGLPLQISIIGGMLSSNLMREHWGLVARHVSVFSNLENSEHCLRILSLSYKSLPIHLKPCFLYMGVFREDEFISVVDLINSWVNEGFIKPVIGETLEETAIQYAKDLIDRNLILYRSVKGRSLFVLEMNSNKCGVHDLLRDLCLRESYKERFIQFPRARNVDGPWENISGTRVCPFCGYGVWENNRRRRGTEINTEHALIFPSNSAAIRRVVCIACRRKYSHVARTKLVRIMTNCHVERWYGIEEILEVPTTLRYLKLDLRFDRLNFGYLPWMHLLWNLQILILDIVLGCNESMILPCVVWDMPQLRCITAPQGASLSDPVATQVEVEPFVVLKNLHTLSVINDFKCSTEVANRVPNLKELYFRCSEETNQSPDSLCNIKRLQKLETLDVVMASQNIAFPDSLKRLVLIYCRMSWEDVSAIGSLTNLEAFSLHGGVEGDEWNPKEGQFKRLKQLRISDTDLAHWGADSTHFPVLEVLHLEQLSSLKEIPSSIGDIATLHTIVVEYCTDSVESSGKEIWEEQQSMGNETLQIRVTKSSGKEYTIGDLN